jgi:RNA polymerase sigma-70 factor (ECF subfamily)
LNPSKSEPREAAAQPAARQPNDSNGDYAAFFRATLAPLQRYLSRLIGSRDEAQDIAQDAYRRVFSVMRERAIEHPRALLYTTARHLALDELKHRSRSPFEHASVDRALCAAPGIEAMVMAREEAALLEAAIHRLPEECRAVLLLRTGEQLTHREVAARLGLTPKQAEKRLHRAVRLLHLELHAPKAERASA